jgi:hypothetical protein
MNGSVVALSLATISSISRCNPEKSRGMFAQRSGRLGCPSKWGRLSLALLDFRTQLRLQLIESAILAFSFKTSKTSRLSVNFVANREGLDWM